VTISGVGTVTGQTLNNSGNLVDAFWGIPFAKPPTGDLRFAAPQPSEPWSGVRNAHFKLYSCPQHVPVTGKPVGTEDCLYLNIYRPRSSAASKVPVMVWIHGGGFVWGNGAMYNGEILSGKQNVVVVTINYRLGFLGFFNIPGTNTKGNYGLLDQILALKWVKEHIGDFGGDARNVTIFGESAGAGSVSLLMLSPLTKDLFSKAILQSGSALNFWAVHLNANTSQAEGFASRLGCKDLHTATTCLRKKSVEEILKLQKVRRADVTILAPSVDKHVISGLPFEQQKAGKLPVSNVDLMIGFTSDEGTMFMPKVTQWNKASYEGHIRGNLAIRYGHDIALETKLASFQYLPFLKPDSLNFQYGFKTFLDDYMFREGITKFAMEWSKNHKNVYLYHFRYRPRHLIKPQWGIAHTLEIDFVFGTPFLNKSILNFLINNFTEEDREMSSKVMKMWADFARNGHPGAGVLPIDTAERKYFEINRNISVKENYDPKMMAFWNEYIPEIAKLKEGRKHNVSSSAPSHKQIVTLVLTTLVLSRILLN